MRSVTKVVAAAVTFFSAVSSSRAASSSRISFDEIENIFAFGDSYSTVGYDPSEGLLDLPLLGGTTSGGLNCIEYLALSSPLTNNAYFDFAQSGATVDNSILCAAGDFPPSFVEQVDTFKEYFVPTPEEVGWTGENALFSVFFGINDMGYTGLQNLNATDLIPRITASWSRLVSSLYDSGARKFLIMAVPPTEKTPYIRSFGKSTIETFVENLANWRSAIDSAVDKLETKYPDASFARFNTSGVFDAVLADPKANGFTVSDRSSTECWNSHDPERVCAGVPRREYVWNDDYHPTFAVHKILAEAVADFLSDDILPSSSLSSSYAPSSTPSSSSTASTASPSPLPLSISETRRYRRTYRRRPAHRHSRPSRAHEVVSLSGEVAEMRKRWAGL
ncbi:hypothetical protein JCM8547_002778 [Rhodosporidiobolus lusitaniae]